MNMQNNKKPDYGNWVSKRILFIPGSLGLIFLGLSFLVPALIIPAVIFILAFGYFLYARVKFSHKGGNIQEKIRELVLSHLGWDGHGEALDIGCGNGALAVELAKKYTHARVIGIDFWGGGWDFSKKACEENAQLEGVSARIIFQKASASKLPFKDGRFDAVVSNFVFHEVADTKDKIDVLKEALRVLKKGGVFSFQDLFLVKEIYGKPDVLIKKIQCLGIEKVELVPTNDLDFIPWTLKLPFMVGEIGIIYGKR